MLRPAACTTTVRSADALRNLTLRPGQRDAYDTRDRDRYESRPPYVDPHGLAMPSARLAVTAAAAPRPAYEPYPNARGYPGGDGAMCGCGLTSGRLWGGAVSTRGSVRALSAAAVRAAVRPCRLRTYGAAVAASGPYHPQAPPTRRSMRHRAQVPVRVSHADADALQRIPSSTPPVRLHTTPAATIRRQVRARAVACWRPCRGSGLLARTVGIPEVATSALDVRLVCTAASATRR